MAIPQSFNYTTERSKNQGDFKKKAQKITKPRVQTLGFGAGIDLSSRVVSNQVFSTRMSLTSVFGMGTGGTSLPLTPALSRLRTLKTEQQANRYLRISRRKSPRPISMRWLNMSPCLHLAPINLIVFEGSYSFEMMGYLILRSASRLDAFSVYPFRT